MQSTELALSIIILLFSVILHEVMHGLVALRFGDHTSERAGRLTLNPLPHIDLFGSILLPISMMLFSGGRFAFGYAKPVPVNPSHFSDIRKGELLVSMAGILANMALAVTAAIVFRTLQFNQFSTSLLSQALINAVAINISLAIFNLIPIPPLDGSKILISQLPYNLARQVQSLEPFGMIILLVLLVTGIINLLGSLVIMPLFNLLLGF